MIKEVILRPGKSGFKLIFKIGQRAIVEKLNNQQKENQAQGMGRRSRKSSRKLNRKSPTISSFPSNQP